MKKIQIFDTTLRDGEQSPGCSMSIEEKIEIAKQLERLNVDVIEAGFAASSDSDRKAIQYISKAISKPIITTLARLTKSDIDKANDSLRYAKKKRIHIFIATSDIHLKYKLKMTRNEVINKVSEMVRYAKSLVDDIEFSLEDATRTDINFACQVIDCAIKAGANVINIPDTVGIMMPEEYMEFIKKIKMNVKNINTVVLSCHCHNDLGLATANSLAGIKMGIEQVECTINGIGERAGNTSLEEIVAILKTRANYFSSYTDINTRQIYNTSKLLCSITGSMVQNNKPIVGANAFKHEAGIHQHGILENRETYEIMQAEDYGIFIDHIKLGIHSGKHAIINKMQKMGYDIDNYDVIKILNDYKKHFEMHNSITDYEFIDIISNNKSTNKVNKLLKS